MLANLLVIAFCATSIYATISVENDKPITHLLASFSPTDYTNYVASLIHIEDTCNMKGDYVLNGLVVISKNDYRCSYVSSTLNVEKYGAIGLMMFVNEPGVGFMSPPLDDLTGRSSDIKIQTVLITKEDGEQILEQLKTQQTIPIEFQPDQDRSKIRANNAFIWFFVTVLSIQLIVTLYFVIPGFIGNQLQWPVLLSFLTTIVYIVSMWMQAFLDIWGSRSIMPLAASQIWVGLTIDAIMCLCFLLVYVWEHAMKFNEDMVNNIKKLKIKIAVSWGILLLADLVRVIMVAVGYTLYLSITIWCSILIVLCVFQVVLFYYYSRKLLKIFSVFSSQRRVLEKRFVMYSATLAILGVGGEAINLVLWILFYDSLGTWSRIFWNWWILTPTLFTFTVPNAYGYIHKLSRPASTVIDLSEKSSGSSKFTSVT